MLVLVSPILRVSEAARTGDVSELKRVLDAETIVKRDFLLKTRTDGATPLIVAARNGNTAIVQCLLNDYDVDLEQEGTVKIDGDLIECCTPLWMASLGGHLAIVRLLLERGAEVNHTTLTNSTPLRAASFNGHTEVQIKRHLCLNYSHWYLTWNECWEEGSFTLHPMSNSLFVSQERKHEAIVRRE